MCDDDEYAEPRPHITDPAVVAMLDAMLAKGTSPSEIARETGLTVRVSRVIVRTHLRILRSVVYKRTTPEYHKLVVALTRAHSYYRLRTNPSIKKRDAVIAKLLTDHPELMQRDIVKITGHSVDIVKKVAKRMGLPDYREI
jgi:hypothetical protein